MLKTADRLILRGFVGPYIVSFFIVEFVLIMNFMWKYIDDLLGRGFSMLDYMELIALFSVTLIPMALPLTVLLSSVMIYGDMAEHYELSSLKSAGLSLVRIFRPALIVSICTAILSIASFNYFKPIASKAFLKKFNDMKLSKVTFAFEEKIFNLDFRNHAIYVDKKDEDGRNLEKVLIYYVNPRDKYLMDVLTAERATMQVSPDGKYLVMDLFDGQQYQEAKFPGGPTNYLVNPDRNLPLNRAVFKSYRKVFELKDIFRDMSGINLERKKYDMLNSFQIMDQVDSLNQQIRKRQLDNFYSYRDLIKSEKQEEISMDNLDIPEGEMPTLDLKNIKKPKKVVKAYRPKQGVPSYKVISQVFTSINESGTDERPLVTHLPQEAKGIILNGSITKLSSLKTKNFNNLNKTRTIGRNIQKFLHRLHQQYCNALVCILLLFIGGPMGAIVKKGGFGYPMLIAIGFYTSFIIFMILGERLAFIGTVNGAVGAWLPFFILLPFAIITTYFALKDIPVSFSFLKRLIPRKKSKSMMA